MSDCSEMYNLEEVLKDWEMKLVWDAAFDDGKIKAKQEVAKKMLANKLPLELIVQLTGFTLTEIENLPNEDFDDE